MWTPSSIICRLALWHPAAVTAGWRHDTQQQQLQQFGVRSNGSRCHIRTDKHLSAMDPHTWECRRAWCPLPPASAHGARHVPAQRTPVAPGTRPIWDGAPWLCKLACSLIPSWPFLGDVSLSHGSRLCKHTTVEVRQYGPVLKLMTTGGTPGAGGIASQLWLGAAPRGGTLIRQLGLRAAKA